MQDFAWSVCAARCLCPLHAQIDNAPLVVEGDMGTVCYPNGDMFEGQVGAVAFGPNG